MFKVVLVDDEAIIRKGLRNFVNWQQYGCEICGEASNGKQGCVLVKELLPDIIFVDIRMHEMNGLAMINEIKNIVPFAKIIILTGYRDFEYAKEAVKLGVFDFLLKPSKMNEVDRVIENAVKELIKEKEKKDEFDRLNKIFSENEALMRQKFLYDLIYGLNVEPRELLTKSELYGIHFNQFVMVLVERDRDDTQENPKESIYQNQLIQLGIIQIFNEQLKDLFDSTHIIIDNDRTAFILSLKPNQSFDANFLTDRCIEIQEKVTALYEFSITFAISTEGEDIVQLPDKFKECQKALEYKFYMGLNAIICYKDITVFFDCEDYDTLNSLKALLLEGIRLGNEKIVKSKLQSIENYTKNYVLEGNDKLKSFYWDTICYINSIRSSILSEKPEQNSHNNNIITFFNMIEQCNSLKDLNDILCKASIHITQKVNQFNNKRIDLKVVKALEYISDHYKEQITLNDLAENIFVSKYYASRIFNKEIGKSFVDVLNETRVEKAKELLKDVQYKAYEVADMVGIADGHYFSRIFKKYTGISPSEYKEMNTVLNVTVK